MTATEAIKKHKKLLPAFNILQSEILELETIIEKQGKKPPKPKANKFQSALDWREKQRSKGINKTTT